MKDSLTKGQQNDIALCEWFYPACVGKYTELDIKEYLALSERGEDLNGNKIPKTEREDSKFSKNPLIVAKGRRGLHMAMWEDGIMDCSVPYFTLLGGYEGVRKWYNPMRWLKGRFYHKPIPRFVVDFMKKEMFKGADADIIENCYQYLFDPSVFTLSQLLA